MTFQETYEKALGMSAHDAAEAVKDAEKNLYEKAQDLIHGAAENIGESVNKAAKNLNEAAKEQWGKMAGDENNYGNLILGLFVGVASILFVYGVCKAVCCFQKPKNEEK